VVRFAEFDVETAPVGPPAWLPGGEPLVGVLEPPVMLLLELVGAGVRIRIPARPELLDELVSLFRGGQLAENGLLFRADDVEDVLFEPLLVIVGLHLFLPLLPLRQSGPGRVDDQSEGEQGRDVVANHAIPPALTERRVWCASPASAVPRETPRPFCAALGASRRRIAIRCGLHGDSNSGWGRWHHQ